MKVAILAPANVVHTQRWVTGLADRGVELLLVTQHHPGVWCIPDSVQLHQLPFGGRLGYFLNAFDLRRVLFKFSPDLVNCHYASGYGTLASLVGFHPTLLSVWGSDVFDYPYQSALAGKLIRRNLANADRIASTSHVMADQVRKLDPGVGDIAITPFGVECDRFSPLRGSNCGETITIGTVKTLADKYGVDTLIEAFGLLRRSSDLLSAGLRSRLRLLLVGEGPDRAKLEALVVSLGLQEYVTFAGGVPHDEVPAWLNRLDIYVAASRLDSESFGVAIIEASSCELPVVVTNVGGLPEVVRDGVTGLVVPKNDPTALSSAIARLVKHESVRFDMGKAGRELVKREYEWGKCVERMLQCYEATICAHSEAKALIGY